MGEGAIRKPLEREENELRVPSSFLGHFIAQKAASLGAIGRVSVMVISHMMLRKLALASVLQILAFIVVLPEMTFAADPTGTLDTINGFIVLGWSFDPDAPSDSIEVQFYVNGTSTTGVFAGSAITTFLRPDVNQTFGITGKHGFRWFVPHPFRDGQQHSLYAYGIDSQNPNSKALLNKSPQSFMVNPPPLIETGQPYNIGAWYFTAWSPYDTFHTNNTLRIYGRADVWGGVRDHALGADPWGLHMDYSSREPLLGFYDLMDQQIMDTHINMAAIRGISFFDFYWNWNSDSDQEDGVSVPLHRFISSSLKNRIKFLLAPIKLGNAPMTVSMWKNSVVPFMLNNYLLDSSYLRTADGRPIIVLFGLGFTNAMEIDSAVTILRDSVTSATGENPLLLWMYDQGLTTDDLDYVQTMLHTDGFAGFQLGPAEPAEPYDTTLSRWEAFTRVQKDFYYFPCASTGLDRRPWWQIGYGYPGLGVNDSPYNTEINLSSFSKHLRSIKHYLDEYPRETSKTLIIYAWNEWGEGGIIEPSVVYGYQYLDSIRQVFELSLSWTPETVRQRIVYDWEKTS